MRMTESTQARERSAARPMAVLCFLLLIVTPCAFAQSRPVIRSGPGTGDPYEELVPWRFLAKGDPLIKEPLVLYWLPATPEEVEKSPLLNSKALLQDTHRCLEFEIVLPADAAMVDKLGEKGKLPAVVLVDLQGNVVRRVEGTGGRLSLPSVERMVSDEFNARGETMYARITEAKKRLGSGDKEGAIDLYKKLWDERCLFPMAGGEAQRALKSLGVIVVEPPPQIPIDPNLAPPATTTAKPKPAGGH